MGGAEHKRGQMTEWGWFLGIHWPFVLVGTKVDNWKDCKILNVSRKKIKVYESCYAFFDPLSVESPSFDKMELHVVADVEPVISGVPDSVHFKVNDDSAQWMVPDHVPSVKVLRDSEQNAEMNKSEPNLSFTPATRSAEVYSSQAEGKHSPDHVSIDVTRIYQQLEELKKTAELIPMSSMRDKIVSTIKSFQDVGGYPKRGQLKVGKRKSQFGNVNEGNVIDKAKRAKGVSTIDAARADDHVPLDKAVKKVTKKSKKVHFRKGMRVSMNTVDFDGSVPGCWSKGRPKLTFGRLLGWRKNGKATVLWEGDKVVDKRFNPNMHQLTPAPLSSVIMSIMMALEVGAIPSFSPTDQS
jgi:hypothetical protein